MILLKSFICVNFIYIQNIGSLVQNEPVQTCGRILSSSKHVLLVITPLRTNAVNGLMSLNKIIHEEFLFIIIKCLHLSSRINGSNLKIDYTLYLTE